MDRKATGISIVTVIGIDIGRTRSTLVGLDQRGAIALRQKLSRGQVASRLANVAPCLVRHGGLRRRPSSEPSALGPRPRREAGARTVCEALSQGSEATPKRWPRPCSVPPCASCPPRVLTSWTCKRCIGCVRAWSASVPPSSTRSGPFCWSAVSPCARACASCATRSQTSSPIAQHADAEDSEHNRGSRRRLTSPRRAH
jgi:hypothetical protein